MDNYLKKQKVEQTYSSAVIDLVDSDAEEAENEPAGDDDVNVSSSSRQHSHAEYSAKKTEEEEGDEMARSLISCFDEIAESDKTQSEFDSPSGKIEWHAFTQQPCSQDDTFISTNIDEGGEHQKQKYVSCFMMSQGFGSTLNSILSIRLHANTNQQNLRLSNHQSDAFLDHTNENPGADTSGTGSPNHQESLQINSTCKTCVAKKGGSTDENGDAVLELLRSVCLL